MTGRYWKYFLDTLRYPEIQHGGPLAMLAEAEGAELDALYDSAVKLREQHFPKRAEKEGVLIHGRGRGVPRHLLENDGQYRERVEKAWAWQWLAGRVHGLEKIFASYGFPKVELPAVDHPGHWAEFDLLVESPPGSPLTNETWELLYWIIFEYKRASAMLRTLRISKKIKGRVKVKMAAALGEIFTLYPPALEPKATLPLRLGIVPLTHERWRLGCGYCGHLPPAALRTALHVKVKTITHERWKIGNSGGMNQ